MAPRPAPASTTVTAATDNKVTQKPVSDSIFGGTGDIMVPPAPLREAWPVMSDSKESLESTGEQAGPDPTGTPDAPVTSSAPVNFVPADEDVDLNAEAARLGINTHQE